MEDANRQQQIHDKGFNLFENGNKGIYRTADPYEFAKIKVGLRVVDNATLDLQTYDKIRYKNSNVGITKSDVLRAVATENLKDMRRISNFFYRIDGIYQRVCDHMANLYRYDWYVMPEVLDEDVSKNSALKAFSKMLNFLDNTNIKKMCGDIALTVAKNGCYYGYIVEGGDKIILQELPVNYCRSLYTSNGNPVVEFNMKFFDTFRDSTYRSKVLKLFPKEFEKGYELYCQAKLKPDNILSDIDNNGWYTLDVEKTVKFNLNDGDTPPFVSSIPFLMDLNEAQAIDRQRQIQKITKLLIQKLPRDKNGDLIFDVDEGRDLHETAKATVEKMPGIEVFTTFADTDVVDLSDRSSTSSTDELEKMERGVFNSFGISQNLFNASGNLAVNNSVLDDEAFMRTLLLQFNAFFNRVISGMSFYTSKKMKFRFFMLETTQYNYRDLAKMYKEQTQIGDSKMLPQIALGHSQSFILNSAIFENEILNLSSIMIPPLMSSTLNSEDILGKSKSTDKEKNQEIVQDDKEAGRPEKPDNEKSEKTIQNIESMS